jgi:hypothetical protein
MPQTPKKKQQDIKSGQPITSPPARINQRTGDAKPGQSKFLTDGANRRTKAAVTQAVDKVKQASLEKKMPDLYKQKDIAKLRASEAALDKVNPLRKVQLGVDSDTLQKGLVRNNQATNMLKLPPSEKGKYSQLFKEGQKLSRAGDVHLQRAQQLMDPKNTLDQQMKSTAESRKAVFDEANKLEQDLAKNQGRKPVTNRPSTPAQVQSKATPKPSGTPAPIETATKSALGASVLASPLAKGALTIGAVAAAQKGAGMKPSQEMAMVNDWNKKTNYGRLLGIKKSK